ncbi:pimeloyl-ACP methyl ester carboxylesterase [Sphingomonas sp. F9_3S_D5_B_2]
MSGGEIRQIDVEGRGVACRLREGRSPTLVFLPGYASDMEGTKALALNGFAGQHGLAMLRFDYSGTGASPGSFEDGTLALWLADALAVVDQATSGPLILVGSSMGGWLALHIALRRPERVRAIVGIAAAADFTDWGFSETLRDALREQRRLGDPDSAGPPGMTYQFWRSGQDLLLLGTDIAVQCPVRLLHGDADNEVPLDVAMRIKDRLRSGDVQLTVVKGGGHRLSEPHEIDLLLRTVAALVERQP